MCVCVCVCVLSNFSHVWLCVTPWTIACQASLSTGFCRQDYKSEWSCLVPRGLPNPGIEHRSPALQVISLPTDPPGKPIGREHHEKCWAGWLTSGNQDFQEKHQQPQICRWYQPNGRKQRVSWWMGKRRVKKLA